MADLSITAASVVKGSGATVNNLKLAGETITAGMSVYLKSTDDRWYKAQSDGTAEEAGSGGLAVALNGASAGQPLFVQTAGTITIGATVAVGTVYVVSAAYGGICPVADLVSTRYLSILGYASAAGTLTINTNATGVALA